MYVAAAIVTLAGAVVASGVHPLVGIALTVALLSAPRVLADIRLAFIAVLAVIALLPFAALPLGIGFNPTLLDFGLVALYGIWVVRLATRQDSLVPLPPLALGVVAFMGLAVVSFVMGLEHAVPSKNQIRVFGELLAACGLYFVVWTLVSGKASLTTAFRALIVLGVAAAVVGLLLYALPDLTEMRVLSWLRVLDYPSGPGVLRYLNDDPARLQRATGTSIDPNSFGGMLAVVAALLVPQIVSRSPLLPRWAALAGTALLVTALLATVSRGSLLAFAAGVVVVALARDRRLLVAAAVVGGLLLAASSVIPWTARYVEHFTAGLAGEDLATRMRFGEYADALRLIERYPGVGVGFGGVRDVDLYRGVSSLYLIIAETMGLVGLAAFLLLAVLFLVRLGTGFGQLGGTGDGTRALVLGSVAALVAALVGGLFDHYFFTYPHAFALLWLILGLGVTAVREGGLAAEPLWNDAGGPSLATRPPGRVGELACPKPTSH